MAKITLLYAEPVPLTATHDIAEFQSGEPALDEWLRARALQNMDMAASKTYVICPQGTQTVIGFYAICMGPVSYTHLDVYKRQA